MKILNKILIIASIIILTTSYIPINISNAKNEVEKENETVSLENDMKFGVELPTGNDVISLRNIVQKFLAALRLISVLLLILIVASTGFRYITATTADIKSEIKETMFPIIVGLIIVFSAVEIAGFILGTFEK